MLQSIRLDLLLKVIDQVQGVDYDETYSPVATPKSMSESFLAIAAILSTMRYGRMDVKTAFLNGNP